MKYSYPYKLYLISLIIYTVFSIYGFYSIYEATKGFIILRIIYILFTLSIANWYLDKYSYYKDRYVVLDNSKIIINNKSSREIIKKDDIDCIVMANHKQLFKIHNVIHVFTKNSKYYYFTNELNKYRDFKKNIKILFPENYIEKKQIIPNSVKINKNSLLNWD